MKPPLTINIASDPVTTLRVVEKNISIRANDGVIRVLDATQARELGAALIAAADIVENRPTHECMWCPLEIRDLWALAHNAAVNYGGPREQKTMAGLKDAIAHYQTAVDAHFKAIGK